MCIDHKLREFHVQMPNCALWKCFLWKYTTQPILEHDGVDFQVIFSGGRLEFRIYNIKSSSFRSLTAAITWACLDCCCKPIELPNASEYNTDLVLRRWMLHPETTPSSANKHEVVRFGNIKMVRWCVWSYVIGIVCMLYVYG